jgi:hypothetical protein
LSSLFCPASNTTVISGAGAAPAAAQIALCRARSAPTSRRSDRFCLALPRWAVGALPLAVAMKVAKLVMSRATDEQSSPNSLTIASAMAWLISGTLFAQASLPGPDASANQDQLSRETQARQRLVENEDVRAARLLDAQARAAELFAAIEASDAVRDLAYIAPGSGKPMRRTDRNGQVCHWILEVHLVEEDRQIGGFFEQLLDIGPDPA